LSSDLLLGAKSRDSNNTALHNVFTNGSGHITFTSPSIVGVEHMTISLLWLELASTSGNISSRARCVAISSFGDGTGGGLVWPDGEPEKAAYRCEGCRELIPHHKSWMVERGELVAQNPGSPIPAFRVVAVDLAEALVGKKRNGVPGRQEVAGNAEGLHEHRARGAVGGARLAAGLGEGLPAPRAVRVGYRAGSCPAAGWAKRPASLRVWSAGGPALSDAEGEAIWDMFRRARGKSAQFAFKDPDSGTRYSNCRFAADTLDWHYVGPGCDSVQVQIQQLI
jgi:hypothetical protein